VSGRSRAAWAAILAIAPLALGCSASSTATQPSGQTSGDAAVDTGAAGCLLCDDASIDAAPVVHVKEIIDQVCGNPDGCHGAGAGNMSIFSGAEFDAMIGVASSEDPALLRVAPGDPAHSYVYLKLACDGGIFGACMPLTTGFDAPTARLFHDWIEAGAPTQ